MKPKFESYNYIFLKVVFNNNFLWHIINTLYKTDIDGARSIDVKNKNIAQRIIFYNISKINWC